MVRYQSTITLGEYLPLKPCAKARKINIQPVISKPVAVYNKISNKIVKTGKKLDSKITNLLKQYPDVKSLIANKTKFNALVYKINKYKFNKLLNQFPLAPNIFNPALVQDYSRAELISFAKDEQTAAHRKLINNEFARRKRLQKKAIAAEAAQIKRKLQAFRRARIHAYKCAHMPTADEHKEPIDTENQFELLPIIDDHDDGIYVYLGKPKYERKQAASLPRKRYERVVRVRIPCERNAELAMILRDKIRLMQLERLPSNCRNNLREYEIRKLGSRLINDYPKYVAAVPEGDMPGVDGEDHTTQEAVSNVILTTQREDSTAIASAPVPTWSQWTSNDIVDSYSTITDRWYQVHQDIWTKDDPFDKEIYRISLPRHLLRHIESNAENVCDVPNTIPFKVHAYWRGDLEVKIQINSNKFQVGQLQATWYYNDDRNSTIATKRSVYGFSQMQHVLISASSSNEATFVIPFKNVYPFLPTGTVPDWQGDPLNMGSLSLRVIAPLRMSNTGPSQCSIITFVRLVKSEFTGTRTGKFYKVMPEMDLAVSTAENLLTSVLGGRNMDNPPYVQPPQYFVPTGSHSLALGTNVSEPLHALRLDAKGQTQHMSGCSTDEAMTVSSIAQHYGLINHIQWSKDHAQGSKLFSIDADPFPLMAATRGAVDTYWVPPVGVVAGNFMYWRGSLEYRFDIIASQFHTGRLIVGYVPGLSADRAIINSNTLKSSPYVVFDLQEGNSFTYKVPYVSYRPWWPRKYAGNYPVSTTLAPSRLFVFVQVPLVPMESVSAELDINIYLRGDVSFEVSVPVQPCFGLNWDTRFLLRKTEEYRALNGYAPYYGGVWHGLNSSNNLLFRYGTLSDQIAQFPTPSVGKNEYAYFALEDQSAAPKGKIPWVWMVVWPSGHGYNIGIPLDREMKARGLSEYLYSGGSLNDPRATTYMESAEDQGTGAYSVGNPVWIMKKGTLSNKTRRDVQPALPEGEDQRDTVVLDTTTQLAHTGFGSRFFGENFDDLKTLCRRYQLYGQVTMGNVSDKDIEHCLLMFPCIPQGLKLNIGKSGAINELFNRCRDGIIPLISSGYRYYRGGLRFKVVLPTNAALNIWVQHRPDRRLVSWDQATINLCQSVTTGQGVFNHGYASYLQLTQVNNIIEFEVPFYNATCYNLLQPYHQVADCDSYAVSIGEIAMGISATGEELSQLLNKPIMIYYALADDMQFSSWVGYQPMVVLDNLPAVAQPNAAVKAVPEGPLGMLHEYFRSNVNDIISENVNSAKDAVQSVIDDIGERIENSVTAQSADIGKRQLYIGIVSQLVHALLADSVRSVSWALTSLFAHLGIFTLDVCSKARACIEIIMTSLGMGTQPQRSPDSRVTCMPESEDELRQRCGAWASLIFQGLSSAMSLKASLPKTSAQWTKWMSKDLADCTRLSNAVFIFVRNTFDVLKEVVSYLGAYTCSEARLLRTIETCPEMLKAWVKECLHLNSPEYRLRRADDQAYVERVFSAHAFGQIILSEAIDSESSKHMATLNKIYSDLSQLVADLKQAGANPFIRKECFTMCITGNAGVGKSFMVDQLCRHLLRKTNTKVSGGLKAVISPLSDYWDQVEHQPVLAVDDMFALEAEPMLSKQLAILFLVHSPIVLSPPKADLDGKKMRYNPEIFVYNTNKPFVKFDRVVPEAIFRRRHVLIEVAKSEVVDPGYEPKANCPHCTSNALLDDCDPALLADMHHIRLRLADDVTNEKTSWSKWLTYDEFLKVITPRYVANRQRAARIFKQRCAEAEKDRDSSRIQGEPVETCYNRLYNEMYGAFHNYTQKTLYGDLTNLSSSVMDVIKEKIVGITPTPAQPIWLPTDTLRARPEGPDIVEDEDVEEAPLHSQYEEDEGLFDNTWGEESYSGVFESLVNEGIIGSDFAAQLTAVADKHGDDASAITSWLRPLVEAYRLRDAVRPGSVEMHYYPEQLFGDMRELARASRVLAERSECQHFLPSHKHIYVQEKDLWMMIPTSHGMSRTPAEAECCESCIMGTGVGKWLFYKWWIGRSPTVQQRLRRKDDLLPDYLRANRDVIDCDNLWDQVSIYLRSVYERKVHPILSSLWKFLTQYWPYILAVVGALIPIGSSVYFDYKMFKHNTGQAYNSGDWGVLEPQGMKYGHEIHPHATRVPGRATAAMPQGATQQSAVIEDRIRMNSVLITSITPNLKTATYRGVIIRGRQVLILRHYIDVWRKMPKDTKYYVTYEFMGSQRLSCLRGIEFNPFEREQTFFKGFSDKDQAYESNIVLLHLPVQFPEGKNLTKFFANEKDHWRAYGEGLLVNGRRTEAVPIRTDRKMPHLIDADICDPVILAGVYTYPVHAFGMCGTFLMSTNLERPIIGFHVAGATGAGGYGIAEPLFYESFQTIPKIETEPYDEVQEVVLNNIDTTSFKLETALYPHGVVPKNLAMPQSGQTNIVPSSIHGVFDVRTAPNPLSSSDPRIKPADPLQLGCEKYGMPTKDFPVQSLKRAVEHLSEKLIDNVRPVNGCKIRSLQEAVCGIPSVQGYDSISWETSCGFPLSSMKPASAKGKRWCFTMDVTDQGYKLKSLHPELRRLIEEQMSMRKQGIKPQTIFSDCLKDTCLPVEKNIIPGKTRVFSISPLQFTIPFRQYFLDFMASYRAARLSAEHGIGIDVNSIEWTQLASYLTSKGDKILTGDYSNYGPSLNLEVAKSAFQCIINWILHYTEEEDKEELKRILWIMAQEILCSWHLAKDLVYRIPGGIPSGSPITDILNTVVNSLYMRIAWQEMTHKPLADFTKNVALALYGDDVAVSVSDAVADVFNTETLFDFFNQYGIKFTDTDKLSGKIVKWRSLKESSFLKHGFLPHPTRPGVMLANLDKISIEGAANWVRKGIALDDATIINAKQALELAYGWGPEYYTEVRDKLRNALRDRNLSCDFPTWNDVDDRCFSM